MPDAIEAARRLLEDRLAEIEAEAAKIRTALQSLGSKGAVPRARPPAKPGRRPTKRPRKRAPRGQRRQEFLAAVKKSPGATAAELARRSASPPTRPMPSASACSKAAR